MFVNVAVALLYGRKLVRATVRHLELICGGYNWELKECLQWTFIYAAFFLLCEHCLLNRLKCKTKAKCPI